MTQPAKAPKKNVLPKALAEAPKKPSKLEALLERKGGGRAHTAQRAHGMLSTGLLSLDQGLSGGFGRGQMSEVAGDSMVGKTTLCMKIVAAAQARGETCAWLDVEQSFKDALAVACGVNLETLVYDNPVYAEEATEFVLDLVNTDEVSIIVIDSIGAYNPKKRLEDEVGKAGQPGARARAVGELCERLLGVLAKSNVTLLAINHLTGELATNFLGQQVTKSKGGRTWSYLKRGAIHMKAKQPEIVDGEPVAVEVEVRIDKSYFGPSGRKIKLLNVMGQGFSVYDDLIELGLKLGLIEVVSKSWLQFGEHKRNGRGQFAKYLAEHPEVFQLLRDTIEAAS